jgi:hypothetical protein
MMSMSSANILTDLLDLSMAWAFQGHNPTGSSAPFVEFQHAFLNCTSVIRCPMNKRRSVPHPAELYLHFNSPRQTSKSRDFILAIMPQYEFYRVPNAAKLMGFGQLFADCCNQLRQARSPADRMMAPLLAFGSSETCEVSATDNIPQPTCLGDFIKLLGGGKPILSGETSDITPLKATSSHEIQVRELLCTDVFETIRLIKQCMNASKDLWRFAMGEIEQELQAALENDSSFMKLDQSRDDANTQNIFLILLRIIFEILMAPDPEADQITTALMRRDEFKEFLQPSFLGGLARLTALISCGLSSSSFEWSKQNLTPLMVSFRGHTLLVLVPVSVVQSDGKYGFFLLKSSRGLMLTSQESEERWVLVARNTKMEPSFDVRCLFPPDIEFT